MSAINSPQPIAIGIVGLGRSGWSNHCLPLASLPAEYRIAAAVDPDPERRQQAADQFGCRSYATFEELLADPQVQLVTIATPSHMHLPQTLAALAAGKHVVCEKPMANSVAEADEMIAAAGRADRVLTIFQNRRFAPDFLKVREVIDSGILGRILQIRIAIHAYKRRWDWQTLSKFNGGALNNNASHHIDSALLLLDAERDDQIEVLGHLDRALASGDTEDYTNLVMRAPNRPWVQVETSNAAAIEQDRWYVMGTWGALMGTGSRLRWRVSNVNQLPPREVDPRPTPGRTYNRETYEWQEFTWEAPADAGSESIPFYQSLYQTIRSGKPLAITPQSVRRQIQILNRCRESAARWQQA